VLLPAPERVGGVEWRPRSYWEFHLSQVTTTSLHVGSDYIVLYGTRWKDISQARTGSNDDFCSLLKQRQRTELAFR
jgi:hypothetical protein